MPRPTLAVALLLSLAAAADPPPPTDAQVREWFADLVDGEPDLRADARQSLMGLTPADLPRLVAVARDAHPLAPDAVDAVREVVAHVYLTIDPDGPAGGGPHVIGILWPSIDPDAEDPAGVAVDRRMAGFPARRWLRDGDRVTAVNLHPAGPADRWPDVPVRSGVALRRALQADPAARSAVLVVRRGGYDVRLPIPLVPQPAELAREPISLYVADRDRRADPILAIDVRPGREGGRHSAGRVGRHHGRDRGSVQAGSDTDLI